MSTSRLQACTIGCKVTISAALALAFFLYFCVPYNKQLNNLDRYDRSVMTGKSQTSSYRIDLYHTSAILDSRRGWPCISIHAKTCRSSFSVGKLKNLATFLALVVFAVWHTAMVVRHLGNDAWLALFWNQYNGGSVTKAYWPHYRSIWRGLSLRFSRNDLTLGY